MQDERSFPGMPELSRQPVRDSAPSGPRYVPETRPTPLRAHYVTLSAIALVCGVVAISALELGAPLGSPLVKLCVIVGAPLLVVTMADATLRIWRAAWAWMPLNRGRGLFRLAWVGAMLVLYGLLLGVTMLVVLS